MFEQIGLKSICWQKIPDWRNEESNRGSKLQVASGPADGRLLLQAARPGRHEVGGGGHRRFRVSTAFNDVTHLEIWVPKLPTLMLADLFSNLITI